MLKLVHMEAYADAHAGAAFRRPAAARGARPRADHRSAMPAARRAAVGARPVPAHPHARRAEALPARARHHLRPRHPQPGRGDGARRPDRGDERRPHRAGGHARATSSSAAHRVRRPLHGRPQRHRDRRAARSACATDRMRARCRRRQEPVPAGRRRSATSNTTARSVFVSLDGDGGERLTAIVAERDLLRAAVRRRRRAAVALGLRPTSTNWLPLASAASAAATTGSS